MKYQVLWAAVVCGLSLTAAAGAATYVETFDNWTLGDTPWQMGGVNTIESSGGNPGWWQHARGIDTTVPLVYGEPKSPNWPFVGNYREMQVTSIGMDIQVLDVDFSNLGDRPFTVLLYQDNGTPGDSSDDYAAFQRGANIPDEGAGWASYDFDVPSQSDELPAGWGMLRIGPNSPEDPQWKNVIHNVSSVGFLFGDPELFYIFQMWEIGIDNARISYVPEPAAFGLLALGALVLRRR